jgi:hypothetical protein
MVLRVLIGVWLLTGPVGTAAGRLAAQRLIDRLLVLNPLGTALEHGTNGWTWMPSLAARAGFGPYLNGDTDHAWQQSVTVGAELFRVRETHSLMFVSGLEFIADPHNNIRFNPRTIFWDEAFLWTFRWAERFVQIGYYHRCKHDVDNLSEREQRALIYGGLSIRLIWPTASGVLISPRIEVYTVRQDERIPSALDSVGRSMEQLLGSFGMNAHVKRPLGSRRLGLFASAYGLVNFFGHRRGFVDRFDRVAGAAASGGLTAGLYFVGRAEFRTAFQFEYWPDSGIPARPSGGSLFSLIFSAHTPEIIR